MWLAVHFDLDSGSQLSEEVGCMLVKPRRFRLQMKDFLKQARGCRNLGCLFPVILVVAILMALPWSQPATNDQLWAAAARGAFAGVFVIALLVTGIALIARRMEDLAEARKSTAEAERLLALAMEKGKVARTAAGHGGQWVEVTVYRFHHREYNPFWEAAENSQGYFRNCCEALAELQACRVKFAQLLEGEEHTFPDMDASVGNLIDPRPDMQRLSEVVRDANRDQVFSMISAQRDTTKAVKEGFMGLTEAVRSLERNVVAAIRDLESSVVTEIRRSTAIQAKILQGIQFIA